jgi:hypothetical protein
MARRHDERFVVDADGRRVGVILPLEEYERLLARQRTKTARRRGGPSGYDFSDLAGRLKWQGDAVAAQRALRNEW